jgi:hypothetical protein
MQEERSKVIFARRGLAPSNRNRSALRSPGNCGNLLDFEVVVLFTQKRG